MGLTGSTFTGLDYSGGGDMMEATGVGHIAICVQDMEKALAFYRDILGMRVTQDRMQDTTQGHLTHIYQHRRKNRRQVQLRYGQGNTAPSLVVTSHPGDRSDGKPIKLDQVGISHISFTVKDVKAVALELMSKGIKLAAPLEAYTDAQGKVSTIYVYDPDGILVQFGGGGG
jgi:catechol 2,3-dioxygenase-like lactoylglutathione lyase family enzyme